MPVTLTKSAPIADRAYINTCLNKALAYLPDRGKGCAMIVRYLDLDFEPLVLEPETGDEAGLFCPVDFLQPLGD